MNYGEIQKKNWSLASKDHIINEYNYDDDNDVQLGNNTFYERNKKNGSNNDDEEEEEEETLQSENKQKTARQTMIERKLHEADTRGQTFTYILLP